MDDKKYGLVLAGGGAKGAYQIGALQALKEMGVLDNVIAVAGNSIGSVNMSLLLGADLDKAKGLWSNVVPEDFVDIDIDKPVSVPFVDGVFSREGMIRLLSENVDFAKISALDIPVYITVAEATHDADIMKAKYVKVNGLSSEEILKYVIASSAIPVMYSSVSVGEGRYMDGGFVDNTPVRPVYDGGVKDIIVISNDSEYVPEKDKFPEANLLPIVPSKPLDMDFTIGTVDFSQANIQYRMKLGYMDAKTQMLGYLSGTNVVSDKIIEGNHNLAMHEHNRSVLEASYNSNMQGLAKLLGDL